MFSFTDDERSAYAGSHGISCDGQEREVLAGLSWDETIYLMEHRRNHAKGIREYDPDRKKKAAALESSHKLASLRALGATMRKGS